MFLKQCPKFNQSQKCEAYFSSNDNMNSDDGRGAHASITNLPPALQHRLGSSSRDVKLAKYFVHEKLCKKVQFLQTGNDELMKKVFNQARKFMKYDSDTFMTCVVQDCFTSNQKQDEHSEEWICSGNEESTHSR